MSRRSTPALVAAIALACAMVLKAQTPVPDSRSFPDIVDHFNLLGQGEAPNVKVYLRGKFTFPAFEPVDNPVIRGPDIFCDPI